MISGPDVITELAVTETTRTNIAVQWKPPANGSWQSFRVQVPESPALETVDLTANLTGLKSGKEYTVTVITLAADKTKLSDPVNVTTYTNRFYGNLTVSNVSLTNVSLSWTPGPGNVSQYRVEVSGNTSQVLNSTGLTALVDSLTPGSLYRFQVFPVKCDRDLNPENATVYTNSPGNQARFSTARQKTEAD
ncbi:Receptor-type tyrosine-protein phosphatase eta [Acipenser ruthenus]|uniref:Receptor-type tyrosine-protein phosphatase eta n=1 Tax=Acipenser ruthenus TaxID=7906 RepID=A0A444UU16_ACIRT|nr:Receptor-type tyrosine-protein phosphatase eta [Acipenser ruthenus]